MPLQAQNPKTIQVNATYAKQITLNGRIVKGDLQVGATVMLGAANVSNEGVWTDAGIASSPVSIPNVYALPPKYQSLAPKFAAANAAIIDLIDAVNAVDKIV